MSIASDRVKIWRKKNPSQYREMRRIAERRKRKDPAYRERKRIIQKRCDANRAGKKRILGLELTRRFKLQIIEFMGGKCKRCGFCDARALQVDHVNAADPLWAKSKLGGMPLYRKILDGTLHRSHFQLLCANCNWIKRAEQHETNGMRKRALSAH